MFGFGKPSKKELVKKLTDEFARLGFTAEYDEDEFRLEVRDPGTEATARVQLENVFRNYQGASKRDRPGVVAGVADFVRKGLVGSPPPPWEDAQSQLLPRVTNRFTIELQRLSRDPDPHRMITDNVVECLVLDYPDRMEYVTVNHLQAWGVSFTEAESVARNNLWRISNAPLKELCPGAYRSVWNDQYDAARILLQPLLLQLKVKGDLVAWIPGRNALLVTGVDDHAGLNALLREMDGIERDYPISLTPLRLRGETWEPLALPSDHPLFRKFHSAAQQDRFEDYETQSRMLIEHLQETGVDVHVSEPMTIQDKKTREILLLAIWPNGLETLLPQGDRVLLADPDLGDNPIVHDLSWDEFVAAYGSKLEPTDYWPPRWRVRDWK